MFLLTPRTRAMTSLVISACAFAPSHAYTCSEGSVLLAPLGALAAVPALQVAAATRVARPGYDGAGYSLEELVMFYDYPQLAGRPLLTFGEPTPTRPARISARSTTPARLGVSTARPGRATLAAPAFDSGCLTDDLVANAPPKDSRKEGGQNSYTHAYAAAAKKNRAIGRGARNPDLEPRASKLPSVHNWPEVIDCSAADKQKVLAAWQLAHDYVWTANELTRYVYYAYPAWRSLLWTHGYDGDLDDADDARSGDVAAANWSPRAWFGGYDGDRLSAVRQVVAALWERMKFDPIRFDCDVSPGVQGEGGAFDEDSWSSCQHQNPGGGGSTPSAYHFPVGKIALCDRFFRDGPSRHADWWLAKTMVHELGHWLKWDDGAFDWVTDAHTVWCSNEGIKSPHICHAAGDKMYGSEDAIHLATKHGGYAYRNTDNYAYFITRLGRAVQEGHLKRFPESFDGFPPPPWSPPSGTDNVCTAMQDNKPGNDPGVDICEGLKGASYDQCKGSVTGVLPPLCR